MRKEPVFCTVNVNTWPMAQSFHYYTQTAPTSYTINIAMDVTNMRHALKAHGYKFFPAYLWLVTRAVNNVRELRIAVKDGILGYWETLTPAYPQFHKDDSTTSLLWTEYDDCFTDFYNHYIEDTAKHSKSHGILTSKGIPLPNAYIISCIPWFTFISFSLHNHGIKDYYFPSFEAGGFVETDGKITMPLSVTVHHATTDGYHLKMFFQQLQYAMNNPDEWI